MLFKFGKFWKILAICTSSWVVWNFLGFEFVVITLLSILIAMLNEDRTFLV